MTLALSGREMARSDLAGGPRRHRISECGNSLVLESEALMPLIQGGPPEWIWERTPDPLKWELVPTDRPDGQTVYELRVKCHLEIMRLQFFTREEVQQLASLLTQPGP